MSNLPADKALTISTKLKLIMPILYLVASLIFFILTWPNNVKAHSVIGVAITATAFALWLTARVQLGNAFSLAPQAKYLVKSGIYSKLRHPVYYFSIMAVTGIALFVWHWFMLLPLSLLIVLEVVRIQKEEKLLAATFSKEYTSYKQTTWI